MSWLDGMLFREMFAEGGKGKRHVRLSVSVHDQSQIETFFEYRLCDPQSLKGTFLKQKDSRYRVDAYLFLPRQMGIHAHTYHRDAFYEDLRGLVRLKEPFSTYKDFLGQASRSGSCVSYSPIRNLKNYFYTLNPDHAGFKPFQIEQADAYLFECRVFACMYTSYLKQRLEFFVKKLKLDENFEAHYKRISVFLKRSFYILKCYRKLYEDFVCLGHGDTALALELRLSYEFCLYAFYGELGYLGHDCLLYHRKYLQTSPKLQVTLAAWSRLLQYVQRKHGYLTIHVLSSRYEREQYAFRVRSLKRRMWQVLYVYSKPPPSFLLQKQIAYMIAAGFAAGWAVFANILITQNFLGQSNFQNSVAGLGSMSLIFSFIMAYILKDRIKEISREKIDKGLLGDWPDHREKLWFNDAYQKKHCIGQIEESFKFLTSKHVIPDYIEKARKDALELSLTHDEEVIQYKKTISLSYKGLSKIGFPVLVVRDVLRLNIKNFLSRLDDPEQYYFSVDRYGVAHALPTPKVYYLDMVLSYHGEDSHGGMRPIGLECKRLTINKDGLVKIDFGEKIKV